ncbi:TadE/TadG family type IV pilus assembly protein [Oryzibacter oryziterrae]|uniref:TadE/TadG family type IV pilus assembly protein n=1 Tax=Oryzibacter oryziterrae TaxID=2766474 RepID=UPI001F40D568|nr:TadE/TadG family type IV pilus assembly protein [Oryzibacter oryziterrae]
MTTKGKQAGGKERGRLLPAFLRSKKGTTAVEFGILAVPFVLIIYFVLDVSMMYLADSLLDRSLHKVARQIKTGQAQTAGMTQTTFKSYVCSNMLSMFNCNDNVYINVQVVTDISNVSFLNPVDSSGNFDTNMNFNTGNAGDYVLAQGFLKWTSPMAILANAAGRLADGSVILSSASLFRNEPF